MRGLKFGVGRGANWGGSIKAVQNEGRALVAEAEQIITTVLDRCLHLLTRWIAERVLESARLRQGEGKLEFHDLLVLARNLLRHDPDVRPRSTTTTNGCCSTSSRTPTRSRSSSPPASAGERARASRLGGHRDPPRATVCGRRREAVDLPVPPGQHQDLSEGAAHIGDR